MIVFMGLLLIFMIIGSIIAIETKDLLSSVICVGAVGFGLSIAFLMLGAPDIAITQVVVEVLCLIILIRATVNRDLTDVTSGREFFAMVVCAAILFVVFVFGVQALQNFPQFGHAVIDRVKDAPSNVYIQNSLKQTGASNVVSAVLLDYRAYDTLGEATVLFTAILGALAILRGIARKKKEEIKDE